MGTHKHDHFNQNKESTGEQKPQHVGAVTMDHSPDRNEALSSKIRLNKAGPCVGETFLGKALKGEARASEMWVINDATSFHQEAREAQGHPGGTGCQSTC